MRQRIAQLEGAMEAALRPGRFIGYKAGEAFLRQIVAVAADVGALVGAGHADEAVVLLQTFIAASYEKAREVDDSRGAFGEFVGDLFCDWVRARRAARRTPPRCCWAGWRTTTRE